MRKRSLQVLLGVLCLVLLTVSTALAQSGGDPERGAALYAENCAVCHGPTGEGRIGAELNTAFASINVDEFLRQTIAEGRPGTFMPAWGQEFGGPLPNEDINDIVAYIETWGGGNTPVLPPPRLPSREIPPVPDVAGDPNEGALIFAGNCVACHGERAEGRIGQTLAKEFPSAEPGAYVLDVVTNGIEGTLMPAWGESNGGPLSEEDVQNVTAYVLSLAPVGTSTPQETTLQFSGLPLAILAVVVLGLLLVLGWLTQRRQSTRN
jgi:mono/diheme cytochrome c family protein